MSEGLVEFDQLNDDAKRKAIIDFAKFYVSLIRNNSMELITSYDVDGVIQDINRDLFTNQYNSQTDIIKDSIDDRSNKYAKLLDNMDQKYFSNGNSELKWPDWYQTKYAEIPRGL